MLYTFSTFSLEELQIFDVTESQNCRDWKESLGTINSNPCAKASSIEYIAQESAQMGF